MKHLVNALVAGILLACSAAALARQSQIQIDAPEVAERLEKPVSISLGTDIMQEHEFHVPDASFVKLHFSDFRPAPGTIVLVRNPEGTESYVYTASYKESLTYDASIGDDGVTRFSAMSITGDTAIVEVHSFSVWGGNPGANGDDQIMVDHLIRGFSREELKARPQPRLDAKGSTAAPSIQSFDGDANVQNSCGVNQRMDAVCWAGSDPAAYDRSRPVAKILVGISACTAWRVGPENLMFTNNHCLAEKGYTAATEVWFNYEKSVCGGDGAEQIVKVPADQLVATDYTLDFSLFSVKDFHLVEPFGNLGLEIRDAVLGEEIYIPQHGEGDPKQLSIESDMNPGGFCQVDDTNHDGRDAGTDVGYYCDTESGSSGSPVISSASNKAIALHHYGGCLNSGVKMSLIWPKVRRYFDRVVPEGDYDGPQDPPPDPGNSAPTASFSYACDLLDCSFNGSSSSDEDGTLVSYEWDFGDGSSAVGVSPSHSYAASGSYSVSLTVTDDAGDSDVRTQQLSVEAEAGQLELSATPFKVKGGKWVELNWSGSHTNQVMVLRNGAQLAMTQNSGVYTDYSLPKKSKTATYQVCDSTGSPCSDSVNVTF